MTESRLAFEQFTESARLALGRGDRESAQASLDAVLHSPDAISQARSGGPDALIRLGMLYQDAGLAAGAELFFTEAVATVEQMRGADDSALVPALTCLGNTLIARGAHDDAEPILTRALAISQQHLGAEHPELNGLLNALSRLYLKHGAFVKAEPLLERLLASKRSKGEDHPEVATVLASLAAVRQGVGDHEGAEQLARQVLRIRERTLAPNHFAIASSLELLADSCSARGKLGEALRLYQRALSIREQTLGVGHVSLRIARDRIADLQLQASEASLGDGGDDGAPLFLPSALHPAPRSPLAIPSGVSVPLDAMASLSRTLSIASPSDAARAPLPDFRRVDSARSLDDADESRQQALVLPAFDGVLALRDEFESIESELNGAVPAEASPSRLREIAVSAWTAVSTRPVQAGIVGAGALALLLAALIAQPHAAEDSSRPAARDGVNDIASAETPSAASPGALKAATATSGSANGSIDQRTASNSSTTKQFSAGRDAAAMSSGAARDENESAQSLELARTARAPLPNIVLQGADSVARIPVAASKSGSDPFSKQFWTAETKKEVAAESSSAPTSAKIVGTLPQPLYPEFLRKNGIEGEVVVQFVVDEKGRPDVSSLEVVRSPHDGLTAAVRNVVGRIQFEPARTGGPQSKPRTEVVRVSYEFKTTK